MHSDMQNTFMEVLKWLGGNATALVGNIMKDSYHVKICWIMLVLPFKLNNNPEKRHIVQQNYYNIH